ncbi:MAG: homocysteine biosynthesis protein, partial [Candidatus Wukongarchaeota archaeon]|nr:homocysteine biosynthesis protein [Candidatus Wukongarchaeota archaeon]
LNQFILLNFRNAYQKYNAATNGTDKTIYTYMGKLLANYGNATFSGSGVLSPLSNDPDYEIIGLGTRIFLGGTQGYVIGEGTQHNPKKGFGTIMVRGDAKKMNTEYIRGACFTKYGTTLYVGLGIPIPILNPSLAKKTGISDEDIETSLVDYGVPKLNRPVLRKVSYAELKSGKIEINGKEVKISPLSSLNQARKIAEKLKEEIEKGKFFLSEPVEKLPTDTVFSPMKPEKEAIPFVRQVMKPAVTCKENDSLMEVAKKIVEKDVNHIVIVNDKGKLEGIVTSFDVTRAVALGETSLENIIVRKVITADPNESVAVAARVLDSYNISALPVIDHTNKVFGIITAEDVSRLLAR